MRLDTELSAHLNQVPEAGLEPAWAFTRAILSRLRLPFRHSGG